MDYSNYVDFKVGIALTRVFFWKQKNEIMNFF